MTRKSVAAALLSLASAAALTVLAEGQAHAALRNSAAGYEVQLLTGGSQVQTFSHAGETYALGHMGERYVVRVHNHTGRRAEAVVTVDGRDVIDGKAGDFRNKRGYIVPAYGHIDIDGWRLSQGEVAAFRFSSVSSSYAARTGSAREVGVVGVAVFPERVYMPPPPPRPYYVPRGGYDRMDESDARKSAPAPEGRAGKAGPMAPPRDGDYEESPRERSSYRRPGLGTSFGERMDSRAYEVEFARQNPSYPSVVLGMRYNDRDGLIAMGVDVDGWRRPWRDDRWVRRTAEPFPATDRRYATPPTGWDD